MLQPARLEQEFVIAGDGRIARLDVEGVEIAWRLDTSIGIAEPVSVGLRQAGMATDIGKHSPRLMPLRGSEDGLCRSPASPRPERWPVLLQDRGRLPGPAGPRNRRHRVFSPSSRSREASSRAPMRRRRAAYQAMFMSVW